jgi:hypothetical protein
MKSSSAYIAKVGDGKVCSRELVSWCFLRMEDLQAGLGCKAEIGVRKVLRYLACNVNMEIKKCYGNLALIMVLDPSQEGRNGSQDC